MFMLRLSPTLSRLQRLVGCSILAISTQAFIVGCSSNKPAQVIAQAPRLVSALGRIEPKGKIRKISLPASLSGDRIETLLVEEDEIVSQGTPLAILNSHEARQASLDEARDEVKVQQSALSLVRSGAKKGEIKAQEYKILSLERRLQAEIDNQNATVFAARSKQKAAKIDARRYDYLFKMNAVPEQTRDEYRSKSEVADADLDKAISTQNRVLGTLRSDIEAARGTLDQIKEIRPQEIAKAKSQLEKAVSAMKRAQREYNDTTVRAPEAGRILSINARAGDRVGEDGILTMADTSNMIVIAEVYQTDLPKIRKGQLARITADGFNEVITAQVYEFIPQVKRQSVYSGKPGENLDQRVYEVKLKPIVSPAQNDMIRLASFMQVNVVFDKPVANIP